MPFTRCPCYHYRFDANGDYHVPLKPEPGGVLTHCCCGKCQIPPPNVHPAPPETAGWADHLIHKIVHRRDHLDTMHVLEPDSILFIEESAPWTEADVDRVESYMKSKEGDPQ